MELVEGTFLSMATAYDLRSHLTRVIIYVVVTNHSVKVLTFKRKFKARMDENMSLRSLIRIGFSLFLSLR